MLKARALFIIYIGGLRDILKAAALRYEKTSKPARPRIIPDPQIAVPQRAQRRTGDGPHNVHVVRVRHTMSGRVDARRRKKQSTGSCVMSMRTAY